MNNQTMWENGTNGLRPPPKAGNWAGRAVSYVGQLMDKTFGETTTVDRLFLGAAFIAFVGAILALVGVTFRGHR